MRQIASLCVPPSSEAFIALAFDCYHSVWIEQFTHKEQFGWNNKLPKGCSSKGMIPAEDQKWVAKYTSPDTGSKKLSGWSVEGMRKFHKLCKGNRQARFTGKSQTLEEARALEILKTRRGIQTDTYEEWLKTKSSKKAKKNLPEPAGIDLVEEE